MKPPKKLVLIGHEKRRDIYEGRGGKLFAYSGSKMEHWKMPKFWKIIK